MKTKAQKILEELNKKFNISDERIADILGVKALTVYRWRKGKHNPSAITIEILDVFLKDKIIALQNPGGLNGTQPIKTK
ncbi:MAG: helix-turn-helix transcriptional regulator [Candidatus Omnitrophota bacterium]